MTFLNKYISARILGHKIENLSKDEFGNLIIKNDWPEYKNLEKFFGKHGQNQTSINLPYTIYYGNKAVNRMSCNKKVSKSILRILNRILNHYIKLTGSEVKALALIHELKLDDYSGCLNVRLMKGSKTKWSTHSWGIAIDWCSFLNRYKWGKNKALFAGPEYNYFWKCWEAEGWVSLGRKKNFDFMHVQACK